MVDVSDLTGPTVLLVAILFDPATGRRAEHREDLDAKYADSQEFMWTEGNFGCDCNRRLFMGRSLGESDPDAGQCGDTIILERLTVNGEVVIEAARFEAPDLSKLKVEIPGGKYVPPKRP